jgi:hypothetical protein
VLRCGLLDELYRNPSEAQKQDGVASPVRDKPFNYYRRENVRAFSDCGRSMLGVCMRELVATDLAGVEATPAAL